MTGNTISGSVTITGLTSTTALAVGMGVSGPGIPAGATVTTIAGPTSVTLSVAATATGTGVSLVFSLFSTTKSAYDAVGNVLSVTDPLGNETSTDYDALNRPVEVHYPDSTTTEKSYTPASLVATETDEAESITTHEYDAVGRPTDIYQPDPVTGTKTANSPLTQMGYDPVGNKTSLINPLGNEWSYVYDTRNRQIQELQPAVANAEATGSPVVRPLLKTGYDGVGNVTSKTDARGNTTTMGYDNANWLITTTYPAVPVYGSGSPVAASSSVTHDRDGNVLTVTDEDGNVTTNTYDALNRLTSTMTSPVPGTASARIYNYFAYDPVGNRTQVTDGNGLITKFTYDGLNRLLTTQYDPGTAAATTVTEAYDALNKISRTEGTGRVTQYSYDALNRITDVVYVSSTVDNLHYTRDPVGNVLSVMHPNEMGSLRDVSYTYDKLNRPLTETSDSLTQTHTYDKAGNRITTVYGGTGRSLTFSYDALNRESGITDSTSSLVTGYSYDLNGNIVKKSVANGTSENRTHDARNRVSTLDNETSGSTNIAAYAYQYDKAGNVMQVSEIYPAGSLSNRTITNTYDGVYRLLTETIATTGGSTVTTTYVYDKGHNRTSKAVSGGATTTYVIGNGSNGAGANQIVSATTGSATTAYSYDANGNRSTTTIGANTDTYSYDDENRLIGLNYQTGSSGTGSYAYAYDYRTRRTARTEPGSSTVNISFDGGTSIIEYGSSPSSPEVEYVRGHNYGGGVGGLEYSVRSGAAAFNFFDSRGDVTTQTNASGAVTFQTAYEAFGSQTTTSGSTQDRQKANTKEQDPTGLLNEGFRYRDLATGTFITRDPLGFLDGLNLYTYVRQNPWSKFDPEGMAEFSAAVMIRVNSIGRQLTLPASDVAGRMAAMNEVGQEQERTTERHLYQKMISAAYNAFALIKPALDMGLAKTLANHSSIPASLFLSIPARQPIVPEQWDSDKNQAKHLTAEADPMLHDLGPANIKKIAAARALGATNQYQTDLAGAAATTEAGTAKILSKLVQNAEKDLKPFISARTVAEQATLITDYLRDGSDKFWQRAGDNRHMTPAQVAAWRKDPGTYKLPNGQSPAPLRDTDVKNDQLKQIQDAEKKTRPTG